MTKKFDPKAFTPVHPITFPPLISPERLSEIAANTPPPDPVVNISRPLASRTTFHDCRHLPPRYRPWMVAWEAGATFQEIGDAYGEDHVDETLTAFSEEPYPPRPLSPGAQLILRACRRQPVTVGQFRDMAKARHWSEDWLVEQCRNAMDTPREIIREILAGKGMTKPHFTGYDQPARMTSLLDTVLVWKPLLDLLPHVPLCLRV